MKMLKSLWTAPKRWRHEGAEAMWALSILRVIKFYGKCTVFTDELGKMWLEAMQLPVGESLEISLLLEEIRLFDPHNWSLGKLYVNMNQHEPFIQTDGDVFIGRCFPRRMHEASVCTEKLYGRVPDAWFEKLKQVPSHWREAYDKKDGTSFNCGTFGGNDIQSIRRIATAGFDFWQLNADRMSKAPSSDAAICCEEWAIAREYDPLEVSCLHSMDPAGSAMLAQSKSYCHLPGAAKIEEEWQSKIRQRLELECPGQLRRCIDVANSFSRSRM